MEPFEQNIEKKYFTIGEVAKMYNVKPSLIRFYEREFDFISPQRSLNNRRVFTRTQIEQIALIFTLTKKHKLTLEGVKDYFKNQRKHKTDVTALLQSIEELKSFLLELKRKI